MSSGANGDIVQSSAGSVRAVPRAMLGANPLAVRVHQQAIVAEFGRRVIRTKNLDSLLHDAAALAADGLGVDRAKVLELLPTRGALLVRAGVGWSEGVVGVATVGADLESPAGYAVHTGQPVIADDLASETRFRVPELMRRHGIQSAVNVIIRGDGEPFGVLEVDSTTLQSFTADDVNFLEGFANLLAAAIERQKTTDLMATIITEKSLLLRELQHRVKNNIQVILSLISLQARKTRTPEVRDELQRLGKRVDALRLVHDKFYHADGIAGLELGTYLSELCRNLFRFQGAEDDALGLETSFADINVDADTAVPLGLIVNEFIVNSLKHAFPARKGTVSIRTERIEPGRVRLTLSDDGIGFARETAGNGGLGRQLIELLARQIDGEIAWETGLGTRLTLAFAA